ncbi:MAG: hypothetical protein ACJ0DH_08445 [bacterium]
MGDDVLVRTQINSEFFERLVARVAWKRFRHLPAGACIDFPGT